MLAAVYVRTQSAELRGFDLGLAALVVLASEAMVQLSHFADSFWVLVVLTVLVSALSAVVGGLWNVFLLGRTERLPDPGGTVLVSGLGFLAVAMGIAGVFRGPGVEFINGLSSAPSDVMSAPFQLAFACLACGAVALVIWFRSRAYLQIRMLEQDRDFAVELGCSSKKIAWKVGLAMGAIAGLAGIAQAAVLGSSLGGGIRVFLLGAAAALLLLEFGLMGILGSAILLAAADLFIAYWFEPRWSDPALYSILLVVLLLRGYSRTAEGVR